jgi:chromate transporter
MRLYLDVFFTFFRIGAFTIGGGYAMISLVQKEVVDRKNWLGKDEFLDTLAIAQSTPGILAVNIAIFVGYKLLKWKGSVVSSLGAILPSFTIILLIAMYFSGIQENPVVERIFKGIRPAVVALIAAPVFNTAKQAKINIRTVWIPVTAALLIWLLGVSPVFVVLGAIAGGIACKKFMEPDNKK